MSLNEPRLMSESSGDISFITTSVSIIATTSVMSGSQEIPVTEYLIDQVILEAEGSAFLNLANAWCDACKAGTVNASPAVVKKLLDILIQKLKTWDLWRSERMHILVFQLLELLSPIWLCEGGEMRRLVEKLFPRWAERKIMDGGSWKSRAYFAIFLGYYLSADSLQRWWREGDADQSMDLDDQTVPVDDEGTPRDMLGDLMLDGDVRVRYITSVLYPTVFQMIEETGLDAMKIYGSKMTPKLPADPSWYFSVFFAVQR